MNPIPTLDYNVVVRSHLRWAAKIPALLIGPTFVAALIGGGIAVARFVPIGWLRIAGPLVLTGGGIFLAYHMIHTFSWVEFDGHVLRARHLYTRLLWVHPREQITAVVPAYSKVPDYAMNAIADHIIGPVRGYEIQIAGRRRGIWLAVGDTAGAAELAETSARAIGKPIEFRHDRGSPTRR